MIAEIQAKKKRNTDLANDGGKDMVQNNELPNCAHLFNDQVGRERN